MTTQSWSRSGDALDPQDCEDGPGHEWVPAGGGLLICVNCESESWDHSGEPEICPQCFEPDCMEDTHGP